jgi:hypothetical protein
LALGDTELRADDVVHVIVAEIELQKPFEGLLQAGDVLNRT